MHFASAKRVRIRRRLRRCFGDLGGLDREPGRELVGLIVAMDARAKARRA
jgi:hypothetical protein